MKYISLIAFTALIILSCEGAKTKVLKLSWLQTILSKYEKKKNELDNKQQEIAEQQKLLNEKIKELDPLEKVPLVTTFSQVTPNFSHYVELQGSVETNQNLVIYPEYSGVMTRVYVTEGQKVNKGQALAKIDDGGS